MSKELTPEQEAKIPEHRDKWLEIGLSTDNTVKPDLDLFTRVYKEGGYKPPEHIIHVPSPLMGARVASVWGAYEDNESSNAPYEEELEAAFDLLPIPKGQKNKIVSAASGNVSNVLYKCGYGSHDAGWLVLYDFYMNVIKVKGLEPLLPLMELARVSGWWWPYENAVIVCEKPIAIHVDEEYRIHANGMMAVEYSDGFGGYAWHDTKIPAKWGKVHSERWEPTWLLEEENAELKRILIGELGYARIMAGLDSTLIHKEDDMELVQVNNVEMDGTAGMAGIDIEDMRLLKVRCPSTEATYVLRVPPKMDNCESARRWTLHTDDTTKIIQET